MPLLAIDNLSELNELLPESVAREMNVLIVANTDNNLTLTCPQDGFDDDDRKRVEYILDRPLLWTTHELADIRIAVEVAYSTVQNIDGCDWKFATQCPKRWNDLEQTEQDTVRNCSVCSKLVHLCLNDDQVKEHARLGNCVCIVTGGLSGEMGDVILQEFDSNPIDFPDDADASSDNNTL